MEIKNDVVQAILNYLVTKPYSEVYLLVNEIQKADAENNKMLSDHEKCGNA